MLNDTQLTEMVGWQPGPQFRGAWQTVFLCLITLGMCLYTSLHTNIQTLQPWDASGWKSYFLYVFEDFKWILLGLLAPEMVLYIAHRQAEVVRKLIPAVENMWRHVSDRKT